MRTAGMGGRLRFGLGAVAAIAAGAAAVELARFGFFFAAAGALSAGAAPVLMHLRRGPYADLRRARTQARLYRTLAAAGHAAMRADAPAEVHAGLCRAAVQEGGFLLAWVGAPDASGRIVALHGESAGAAGAAYLSGLDARVSESDPRGRGPTGTAWREGRPVIASDLRTDARLGPWRADLLAAGLRSSAAYPIHLKGAVCAVFTIYGDEPGFFTPEIADLLGHMVREAEYALDNQVLAQEARDSGRALHESRRLLSQVLDTLPTACYVRDLDERRLVFASPGIERLVGVSASRVLEMGADFFGLLHPDDAAAFVAAAEERALPDGAVHQRQLRLRRPDGSWRWIRTRATVFERGGDGRVRRMLGSAEDVTDLLALADENRRVAMAVQSAAESVVITDASGTIEYVNPAFCRLTGYSRDEALGRKPSMLKSGRVADETYRSLWEAVRSGRVWEGRLINRRKDGTLFEEEASISPVHDDNGVLTHFVAVKKDVSKELELERELRQAQKLEAIGKLAGGVAHDFNNILTSILGCAELLSAQIPESSPLRADLDEIARGGRRAADLTRQLLIFSRRQVVAPRRLDPAEVVGDLQKMLLRIVGEDCRLAFVNRARGVRVEADPGQFEQVLMNFVVNGRDAMARGGVLEVAVDEARLDAALPGVDGPIPPGRYAVLSVRDEGEGIPAEVLPRIFEPFFTTKPPGVGTGLGLSTVYGIVKQGGAHLEVETVVGRGTTMRVYWPALAPGADPEAASAPAPAPGGTERVLVVEDEDPVRVLVERILTGAGYRVASCRDAGEGLRRAGDGDFSLLLSDVILPGGTNGRDMAAELKKSRPGLKVLFMSGYSGDAIARRGVLEPGARLMQKPFTRDAVLRAVRDALDA